MGFLEEIVRATKDSVGAATYGEDLPKRFSGGRPSLRSALERDREVGSLVVEYKRLSPGHAGERFPVRSVPAFLRTTEAAEPTAYSCLATVPRFEGSPYDVAELARSTPRPVLFKDFVIGRRQIEVAARAGASAVLLIARLETEDRLVEPLSSLADAAHDAGLEVLLEFHARSELSRAANVVADVYGVNMRNLDTLSIDRATATETLREARSRGLRPLLGLSGVSEAADALRFWQQGVDGILVGSAVARSPEPAKFLSTLRRPAPGSPT